jgi:hypothetical protein
MIGEGSAHYLRLPHAQGPPAYDAHRLTSLRARAREALIMGRVRLTRTRILELSSGSLAGLLVVAWLLSLAGLLDAPS